MGPDRARTQIVGSTDIGAGTLKVRLKVAGDSGVSAIEGAHCTLLTPIAQAGLPSGSDPRSHCATAALGGGRGYKAVWRMLTGCAKPWASYWVIDRSVMRTAPPVIRRQCRSR